MNFRLSPHDSAVFQALFVTFLWSTSWVLIKFGLQDIPPLTFAGLRYALAFLILLPLALRGRRRAEVRGIPRSDWVRLALLGLLYYTVTQGAQFVALALLPAVTVNLLLNFTTVIVAFLGVLFLGERLRLTQWVGTVIFVTGALAFFYEDLVGSGLGRSPLEVFGLVVAVAGVLANAASSVLGRGINRDRRHSAISVTVVSMGIGAAVLLVSGIALQGLPSLRFSSWLIIAWLAFVNTAFAFTLWNHTLRTLTAVESSIINNTMLIQIAVLAWLFLGERLGDVQVDGLLLAAMGILIVQLRRLPIPGRASEETREPL
ncbi:MAG TPA: DMT family transporter [Candidatus Binatia bacterium]|jgi:drug/metabolite transporter (DMT)-like permease|nr:DMT family transporter [Candidatus Binatia bacterium]